MSAPALALALLFSQSGDIRAQGEVSDPAGKAVPGATVFLRAGERVVARVVTDQAGHFHLGLTRMWRGPRITGEAILPGVGRAAFRLAKNLDETLHVRLQADRKAVVPDPPLCPRGPWTVAEETFFFGACAELPEDQVGRLPVDLKGNVDPDGDDFRLTRPVAKSRPSQVTLSYRPKGGTMRLRSATLLRERDELAADELSQARALLEKAYGPAKRVDEVHPAPPPAEPSHGGEKHCGERDPASVDVKWSWPTRGGRQLVLEASHRARSMQDPAPEPAGIDQSWDHFTVTLAPPEN